MHKLISYSTNQTQPTREQTPTKPHAGLLSVSAQGLLKMTKCLHLCIGNLHRMSLQAVC